MPPPTDIALLTYNRVEYLAATVAAIERHTPEPFRLTIVDCASQPATRNWIAENGHRFHQVAHLPRNEGLAGWDHARGLLRSDPYILTDPDLLIPQLSPSWLSRLLGLMDRHRDFGLIGVALDPVNRPTVLRGEVLEPVLRPDEIEADLYVGPDLVEGNVGTWFQAIRQGALTASYVTEASIRASLREQGLRIGFCPAIRAHHLGWDDYRRFPGYLVAKEQSARVAPKYWEVGLVPRAPRLSELAAAGPIAALARDARIPEAAVLELAWETPVLGPSLAAAVTLLEPVPDAVPAADCGAGLVCVLGPPAEAVDEQLAEAARIATGVVVLVADLVSTGGRPAPELAPAGWSGQERPATGPAVLAMAQAADTQITPAKRYEVLEHVESWLAFFARAAVEEADRRLFVFQREEPALSCPPAVRLEPHAQPWHPEPDPPPWRRVGPGERLSRARARVLGAAARRAPKRRGG